MWVEIRKVSGRERVGYLYREEPDREEDSGWRILCGDETQEYMDDSDNVCVVSPGAVLSRDDRILELLESPAGAAFELDRSTSTFVLVED